MNANEKRRNHKTRHNRVTLKKCKLIGFKEMNSTDRP